MYMLSVTIAATNTAQCIIPKGPVIDNSNTGFQSMYAQSQGSNDAYIGDSTNAGAHTAFLLNAAGSFGGTQQIAQNSDLKEFWIYGTANDVIVFMIFP